MNAWLSPKKIANWQVPGSPESHHSGVRINAEPPALEGFAEVIVESCAMRKLEEENNSTFYGVWNRLSVDRLNSSPPFVPDACLPPPSKRVMAVARGTRADSLFFCGLVGIMDPPRASAIKFAERMQVRLCEDGATKIVDVWTAGFSLLMLQRGVKFHTLYN